MVFLTRGLALAAAAAVAIAFGPSLLASQDPGEDAVKAAFLYNFTKFIDWPESAFRDERAPFTVCAVAGEPFRKELESILQGEQVRGRRVVVAPAADDIRTCHLVYFSRSEGERYAKTLAGLRQTPILTVGEGRGFLDQGGLIAFMRENDRVRFAITRRGADAAGLHVSSKLLRVARPYDGSPGP